MQLSTSPEAEGPLQNDFEKFERLREDIHAGFHQIERGEGRELDMDKIEARARQRLG